MSTATPTPTPARPDSEPAPDPVDNPSQDLLHDESTVSLPVRNFPDLFRTMLFVAGAVTCLAITALIEFSSRPAEIQDFGKVGEEFYADFTDPTRATSLEVYVFDADEVKLQDFRVERLDNGRWVVPSHHNYPADAEDQLAKTASSIIGIQRGAMVTRWKADHARYGVVNPKQKSLNVKEVEGVGSRIILRGDDDTVLADYIIGNKVDGEFDQYYVRHPEEDDVYIAKLDIDLSTKFTDWIDTDLLDVDRDDIVALTLNDYSFDELQGQITGRDVSALSREKWSEPWKLEGLNEEAEEVDKDRVRDIVNAIADLEIAGVRPKQKGLTPELTLDREVIRTQDDVDRIQTDLLTRGFVLQPAEGNDGQLRLIAREGELSAATKDGLVYHLHFGRVFTGSQEELETGFATSTESDSVAVRSRTEERSEKSSDSEKSDGAEKTDSDSANGAASEKGEPGSQDAKMTPSEEQNAGEGLPDSARPGRYAFVRVEFDATWLGEEPVKPVAPEKPAKLTAGETESISSGKSETAASDESRSKSRDGDKEVVVESEEDPLAEIRKDYEEAKRKYESDLAEYERSKREREEKIREGKEKADTLNRRFAEWYYVIPGDDFDNITLARADIVKEKPESSSTDETGGDSDKVPSEDSDAVSSVPDGATNETSSSGPQRASEDQKGSEADETKSDEAAFDGETPSDRIPPAPTRDD